MFALVIDDTIQSVGRLPGAARILATGEWFCPSGGLAGATVEQQQACGYFAVLDMRPAYDPATHVLERGDVFLSDSSTPVRDYTIRPKTADELAADADTADRQAKGVRVGQAITWLRNHADQYAAAAPVTTNAQALAAINTLRKDLPVLLNGLADLLEHGRYDQLGEA